MDIYKSASENAWQAGNGTVVENTPTPLIDAAYALPVYKYVEIKSTTGNSASIFVGPIGTPVGSGFEIVTGEKLQIPVDSAAKITIWSEDNSEDTFSWIGV
jgi:hypothetical protein